MDVFIVSTALALILTKSGMTGAAAGFIMVFASNITWNVNWMLINLRQFELKGVSLERTTEYRLLPREGGETLNQLDKNYGTDACEELNNWPLHGELKVHELRVRYGPDLPDILHDVSFGVQGGQRVGIVGATGGGKSTLAKAFFSFVDITHGKIEIDGKGKLIVLFQEVTAKTCRYLNHSIGSSTVSTRYNCSRSHSVEWLASAQSRHRGEVFGRRVVRHSTPSPITQTIPIMFVRDLFQ